MGMCPAFTTRDEYGFIFEPDFLGVTLDQTEYLIIQPAFGQKLCLDIWDGKTSTLCLCVPLRIFSSLPVDCPSLADPQG